MAENATLRASVKSAQEAERGQATWWNKPIVLFIPEEKEDGDGKEAFIEVLLKVNMDERNSAANQVNLRLKKYSFGPMEDLIHWTQDLKRVIKKKLIMDPKSKFDMAEMLLLDDPLATFREFRRTVC